MRRPKRHARLALLLLMGGGIALFSLMVSAFDKTNVQLKKPHQASAEYTKKIEQIAYKSCAVTAFEVKTPVLGVAIITPEPRSDIFYIGIAHGANGTTLYNQSGEMIWESEGQSDVVSAYPGKLLVYRETPQSSALERFNVDNSGLVKLVSLETPSEIAPTTLQRSSIASLGPVRLKSEGVQIADNYTQFSSRPTAIASNRLSGAAPFENGIVAIGFEEGRVEIWSKDDLFNPCQ